jgi:general L-amino acid transport system substrate-binding protein
MVRKSSGITSIEELNGASVCLKSGTTSELNLADYFKAKGMHYHSISSDTAAQAKNAFEAYRCDVISSDQSQLYALKTTLKKPSSAIILDEVISKEPLGPVVRQGDERWLDIVRWSLNAMITAEELGVNSRNVDAQFNKPEAARLLGQSGNLNQHLGLDKRWAYQIISQVGNYGQSFERNLGKKTPLNISRGQNALWNKGGLLYSPPFR